LELKTFKIIASIGILTSLLSLASSNYIAFAATAPGGITDLIATPGNGFVELTWGAPIDNGSPITSYKIIVWKTGQDIFTTYPNLGITTTTTVTGLQNGASYSFKVIATNAGGQGPDSNIVSAIPTTTLVSSVPERINDLFAVREDSKVKLTWTQPFDNGASISSYKISYWEVDTSSIRTKTVTSSNAQITGLTNGIPYQFKVVAINSVGHGPDSNIVTATPSASVSASVPGQVRGVVATPSNGAVFLSWIQPSANGSPITSYKVIVSQTGSNVFTTYPNLSTDTATTISGLLNSKSYSFQIVAVNAIGSGKESKSVSAIPVDKVPIAITNLRATPGDGKVSLSWSVPQSALDKISGYRLRQYVYGDDSFISHPITGKATGTTISGLKNGVPYGFSVIAVSAEGIGPTSPIVYATPTSAKPVLGTPNAITTLAATAGDGKVNLSWTAPLNNGSPITGYNIIQSQSGSNSFTTYQKLNTSTSTTISALTNGITYNFKVVAVNDVGQGPVSNTVIVTPINPGQQLEIPTWVKINAKWWAEGRISDIEYSQAIQWLINEGIIKIK
jgi:hypothetical protein